MSTTTLNWTETTYGDGWPSHWTNHGPDHVLVANECADGSWSWALYANGLGPHHVLASESGYATAAEAQRFAEANSWRRYRTASGF